MTRVFAFVAFTALVLTPFYSAKAYRCDSPSSAFIWWDQNYDGSFSLEEWQFADLGDFSVADANNNGLVSAPEYAYYYDVTCG